MFTNLANELGHNLVVVMIMAGSHMLCSTHGKSLHLGRWESRHHTSQLGSPGWTNHLGCALHRLTHIFRDSASPGIPGSRVSFLGIRECDSRSPPETAIILTSCDYPQLPCPGTSVVVIIFPTCSMYGIFTYIWVIFRANVGKYSIHGASGFHSSIHSHPKPTKTPVESWDQWPHLFASCFTHMFIKSCY